MDASGDESAVGRDEESLLDSGVASAGADEHGGIAVKSESLATISSSPRGVEDNKVVVKDDTEDGAGCFRAAHTLRDSRSDKRTEASTETTSDDIDEESATMEHDGMNGNGEEEEVNDGPVVVDVRCCCCRMPEERRQWWLRGASGVLSFVCIVLISLSIVMALLWSGAMKVFLEWVESQKGVGALVLLLLVMVFSFPIPMGLELSMMASGYLYGLVKGMSLNFAGICLGSSICYAVCVQWRERVRLHCCTLSTVLIDDEKVTQYVQSGQPVAAALSRELEAHPFQLAFFMRFLPLPVGVSNAILAVSPIRYWPHFIVGSLLIELRKCATSAYIGASIKDINDLLSGKGHSFGPVEIISMVVGVLFLLIGISLAIYISRRAMQIARRGEQAETVDSEGIEMEVVTPEELGGDDDVEGVRTASDAKIDETSSV